MPRVKKFCNQIENIGKLKLTLKDWKKLENEFILSNRKKVTRPWVFLKISEIKKISYDKILELLNKPPISRRTKRKKEPEINDEIRLKKHRIQGISGPNRFIAVDKYSNLESLSTMGLKVYPCVAPSTPEKGSYYKIFKTPKGSKVRKHIVMKGNNKKITFLAPFTPPQNSKRPQGIFFSTKNKDTELSKQYSESISYTVTKTLIEKNKNRMRRFSQKQLTGMSCRTLFIYEGDEFAKIMEGKYFHWSHKIAHFFGGPQVSTNVIPTTSACNYNTLNLVEQFIADKLSEENGTCEAIHVKVTPKFFEGDDIPIKLTYELEWVELNSENGQEMTHKEKIKINPRSHERYSREERRCIKEVRTLVNNSGN